MSLRVHRQFYVATPRVSAGFQKAALSWRSLTMAEALVTFHKSVLTMTAMLA
jgi:hypothetical protein